MATTVNLAALICLRSRVIESAMPIDRWMGTNTTEKESNIVRYLSGGDSSRMQPRKGWAESIVRQ